MRRKRNYKKEYKPDWKYGSAAINRFINYLMKKGKKRAAEKIMYGALDIIQKAGQEPLQVFEKAVETVSPILEVTTRRIGGANYQVPHEVRQERRFMLAARWIIEAARKKTGRPMAERIAGELVAASKNEGAAIKKKQDTHRMAEANRAFAHFAKSK
jgi:small subunit ribosomal protein S7